MLDIIGYWGAVTFITVSLLAWPLWALVFLILVPFIGGAIPNKEDSAAFKTWFRRKTDHCHVGGSVLYFGRKFKVNWRWEEGLCYFLGCMVVVWGYIILIITYGSDGTGDLLITITRLCLSLAYLFKWVGVLVFCVLIFRMMVRYLYFALKFKEKVDKHIKEGQ
jgi:hypothetical protein